VSITNPVPCRFTPGRYRLRHSLWENDDTRYFRDAVTSLSKSIRSLARMASARSRFPTSTLGQVRISGRRAFVETKSYLRRDPIDHWVISYCVRGTHFANTAGTPVEVPAKVPFLASLGQEFLHERTHIYRVSFLMARDGFRDIAPLLDAACGSTLDTPLGHLLGDYMMALEHHLPDVTEADFPRLARAVGAMVAAAAPSAERVAIAGAQIDVGRKERVRRVIRKHLRTPTFRPSILCRLVGMSRSNLYRLFEDTGGVARYIQRERQLEAHAVLTDPASTQSISSIAEDLCLADASSFSRAFKREFGHSPGELRLAALAGLAPSATPRSPTPSAGTDFGELIRGF